MPIQTPILDVLFHRKKACPPLLKLVQEGRTSFSIKLLLSQFDVLGRFLLV